MLPVRVVDIFAGIGGLSHGWRSAGHDVVAAVERNPYCAATYQANFPDTHVFGADGTDGDLTRISPRLIKQFEADVIVGGPPCQAFSIMGKNDPADPRRSLVDDFVRLAVSARPRLIVMENVPGILHERHVGILRSARAALEAAKFRTDVWTLDAADYAVPQTRRRVFLVARRGREHLTVPTTLPKVTVADAIQDLPSHTGNRWWPLDPSAYAKGLGAARQPVTGHIFTIHRPATIQRLRELAFGESDALTGMRRLHPNGTSRTLRASSRTRTACRPVHPHEPRVITPREAARLSGFPDNFYMSENIAQAVADIGNAVPPPLSEAVARSLVEVRRIPNVAAPQ